MHLATFIVNVCTQILQSNLENRYIYWTETYSPSKISQFWSMLDVIAERVHFTSLSASLRYVPLFLSQSYPLGIHPGIPIC